MTDGVPALVDHLFRHRAGQMVSSLVRIFGVAHVDLAEDVVQEAMLKALRTWPFHGIPTDPTAWLFQVARNRALDAVRRNASLQAKQPEIARWLYPSDDAGGEADRARADAELASELDDGELALLFACCHPAIPADAGIALALRTVAGFSTLEIARAFLVEEATVAQRIVRAKRRLREANVTLGVPHDPGELAARRDAVLAAIYLMFNEGYSAGEGEALVRHDLCGEALRLALLMVRDPATRAPVVHAVVALFCFQMARLPTRTTAGGDVVLLIDQDRARWDRDLIHAGFRHLERAGVGTTLTSYHLQAQIASAHAIATSYADTNWNAILGMYDLLVTVDPSPVVLVNRAIAMSMVHGPDAALAALESAEEHAEVTRYVWFHAARAYVHAEAGRMMNARQDYTRALALTFSEPARRLLTGRLRALSDD
jgi:RNA polymerase sigma-70 factor (ECF subfamily)